MTSALIAAVIALAILTILPGPDVAVITRIALSQGRRAAVIAAFGIVCGLMVWGALTVVGLAALLAASAQAYEVVKIAGAAYLIWLGLETLWHTRRSNALEHGTAPKKKVKPWRLGFISNILNPKIAVFYTSLLPQLVPDGANHTLTLVGLVLVHAILSMCWLAFYALAITRASAVLQRRPMRLALDRITGAVLIGFGARLALSHD